MKTQRSEWCVVMLWVVFLGALGAGDGAAAYAEGKCAGHNTSDFSFVCDADKCKPFKDEVGITVFENKGGYGCCDCFLLGEHENKHAWSNEAPMPVGNGISSLHIRSEKAHVIVCNDAGGGPPCRDWQGNKTKDVNYVGDQFNDKIKYIRVEKVR